MPDYLRHIKWLLWIVLFFLATWCFTDCNNRHPKPPTDNQERPPNDQPEGLHEVLETDGIVNGYTANKDGDIDKLILIAANGEMLLHFPPHTAKQVTGIAVKNSRVHVWFSSRGKPPKHDSDKLQYELISLRADEGSNTLNVHDIPPPKPAMGNEVVVTGNKIQWQEDNNGRNAVFILSGKLIKLPPHAAESLGPLVRNAHYISVKGYERNGSDGFVNSSGLILVKPYAITVDSVHYLVP